MEVQIFGTKKNSDTRKAIRFFTDRRIKVHFVDFNERAASLGELRRFSQKFGIEALIDRESRWFKEAGLQHAQYSEDRWMDQLLDNPFILRQPLVRFQHKITIGLAEAEWKGWVK